MKNLSMILITLVTFASFSKNAEAAIICTGTVGIMGINTTNGNLTVSVGGLNRLVLCSVSSPTGFSIGTISVDACKSIYANLLAAKSSGKTVSLYFQNSGAVTECT